MLKGRNARVWLAFAAVVLLGALVRLPGLSRRTITHPEFYMPGIEIPEGVHHPKPRTTLLTTIQSVFEPSDIHPPGFYLHSLAWTHLFGTTEVALRLPSVLAGTATIALLFLLAWRTDGPAVATAASLGLALHGFHVSKSIQAELWVWPTFWAVLSVWLLNGLLKRTSKPRALAYLMVLTIGLWSEYSFWLFAAIQIAYVAIRESTSPRVPMLTRLQAQAVVLALPVFLHLRKDLTHASRAYLGNNPLDFLGGLLGFGNVAAGGDAWGWLGSGLLNDLAPWLLAALGLALLVPGLTLRAPQPAEAPRSEDLGASCWLPVAGVNALVLFAYSQIVPVGWKFPLALAVAAFGIAVAWKSTTNLGWPPLARVLRPIERAPFVGRLLSDVVAAHGLGFVLVVMIAGMFSKILASRVFLAATPFLLVAFARGWRRIGAWSGPSVQWGIAALIVGIFALSSYDVHTRPLSNREYRAVAEGLAPRVRPGDVVVTRYDWYSAPLHYYLRPDHYNFIHLQDFPDELGAKTQRVWMILYGSKLDPQQRPPADLEAFEKKLGPGFEPFDEFAARNVRVFGYRRASRSAAPPS